MIDKIIQNARPQMEKAITHFREELGKLRAGRASSAMVESIMVDYYGAKSPLKQVASITTPEPRLIVIAPWSPDNLVDIERAINDAKLGINPNNDGKVIRIAIPPLTEERRKELAKVLGKYSEEARISVRQVREESWDEIQELEKDGKIGEDDKFSGKDKLQEIINEFNAKIEEIREMKEKEIMEV